MESAQKLVLDFAPGSRLRPRMDEDTIELIARLCTQAGMRMEDVSVFALTIGGRTATEIEGQMDQLVKASQEILALIAAARALCE